jgi:hypothetical protein
MQLPDDILFIVRQFSRPLLPFGYKYNKCVRALYGHDLQLFHDIKLKLFSHDAEEIMEAFVDYADASSAADRSYLAMAHYLGNTTYNFAFNVSLPHWQDFQRSVAINHLRQTEKLHALRSILYRDQPHLLESWELEN